MQKSTLVEAQESAGFFEPDQRLAMGGFFNFILFFSNIGAAATSEPQGALKEAIDKHFTDFSGFKEAFKMVVQNRCQPGWVWLGLLADGRLIIT